MNVSKIAKHNHLTDNNWHEGKERIKRVFINCDITNYITGRVIRPDETVDPTNASNWDTNNSWIQQVIMHNLTSSQMNHIGSKTLAEAMYSALMFTHENKAHQMVNHIQCLLYKTKIAEVGDMLKHLDMLKCYHDHINKFPDAKFHVSDTHFKAIISGSIPLPWQTYVKHYNGN
jgi:hypothetical protein